MRETYGTGGDATVEGTYGPNGWATMGGSSRRAFWEQQVHIWGVNWDGNQVDAIVTLASLHRSAPHLADALLRRPRGQIVHDSRLPSLHHAFFA